MTKHDLSRAVAPVAILLLALSDCRAQCDASADVRILSSVAEDLFFGTAIAIADDTLFVGARRENSPGRVYVYRLVDGEVVQEQEITAPDASLEDGFGDAVAISAGRLFIGASGSDFRGIDVGSVYVYRQQDGEWQFEQQLTPDDPTTRGGFGSLVAVDGEVAVICTSLYLGTEDFGSAYVYRYDGTEWSFEQKLVRPDPLDEEFAAAVSVSGNVIAIGTPRAFTPRGRTGSAYLYRFDGSRWAEEQEIFGSDAGFLDQQGTSVAVEGNVVLLGAPTASTSQELAGRAYVFRYNGFGWQQEQQLASITDAEGDTFGTAVALRNGTAAVGVPGSELGGPSQGAVYLYRYHGNTWLAEQSLLSADSHRLAGPLAIGRLGVIAGNPKYEVIVGAVSAWSIPESGGCNLGTVNLGNRTTTASDVLTVNGEVGDCPDRSVSLERDTPLVIEMTAPPAGPDPAGFALYAWRREPRPDADVAHPFRLGTVCLPTFMTEGLPKPHIVWNNVGRQRWLGVPNQPSTPAPSVVLNRPGGVGRALTATLQGFIQDNGSDADVPGSVTNLIVLRIE